MNDSSRNKKDGRSFIPAPFESLGPDFLLSAASACPLPVQVSLGSEVDSGGGEADMRETFLFFLCLQLSDAHINSQQSLKESCCLTIDNYVPPTHLLPAAHSFCTCSASSSAQASRGKGGGGTHHILPFGHQRLSLETSEKWRVKRIIYNPRKTLPFFLILLYKCSILSPS